jgi:hypothetical protein
VYSKQLSGFRLMLVKLPTESFLTTCQYPAANACVYDRLCRKTVVPSAYSRSTHEMYISVLVSLQVASLSAFRWITCSWWVKICQPFYMYRYRFGLCPLESITLSVLYRLHRTYDHGYIETTGISILVLLEVSVYFWPILFCFFCFFLCM